jgi:hypothetical protein
VLLEALGNIARTPFAAAVCKRRWQLDHPQRAAAMRYNPIGGVAADVLV